MPTKDGYIHQKYKYDGTQITYQDRYGMVVKVHTPVWKIDWHFKESKYMPHQGYHEQERRRN